MRAFRSFVSLCQISLVIVGFAAGLTMAGCDSNTAVPKSTPAQAPAQAAPGAEVQDKAAARGKSQIVSRHDLYKAKAQAAKDSQ
jgi:hypothetical protein